MSDNNNCHKFSFSTVRIVISVSKVKSLGGAPNLHFPHLHQTQIYISHIYTEPRFTQTQIYTNPDLHQTQIYIALHWHTQIYTTQIYTKLNPNLHIPKFTQAQIYIHIFGQISSNPNSHDPNLHKTQIYTTQNLRNPNLHTTRNSEAPEPCTFRTACDIRTRPEGP